MACVKTQITEDCCYVRFGARPPAGVTSDQIGRTVRGERIIADFDAEGRIVGLELVGGPAKPCQALAAVAPHAANPGMPSTRETDPEDIERILIDDLDDPDGNVM